MSTLNSSQLHVKRSSTRLHAPPGGYSSLSFGLGGFGTTDHDSKVATDPAVDACGPPSTAGSFRGSYGTGSNQGTDYPAFHSIKGTTQAYPSAYPPPATLPPPSGSAQFHGNRPASTQNDYSWGERGSQPPLTSSKRDQNWEKKRRLWLARKNRSGCSTPNTCTASASTFSLPPPPGTTYGSGGFYEMDPGAFNPPSPLTKFMAQQQARQPSYPLMDQGTPQSRLSTAAYDMPHGGPTAGVPPRTALKYREDAPAPPETPYSSGMPVERHLPSTPGYPAGYAGTYAVPSTAASGYGPPRSAMPGTASSSSSATTSYRRQPPGGNSNWSPYS